MTEILLGPWRKSSYSAEEANCVELAWRTSSYSAEESNCVEVSSAGAVRDSKNQAGPRLRVDLAELLEAVKAGRFDR